MRAAGVVGAEVAIETAGAVEIGIATAIAIERARESAVAAEVETGTAIETAAVVAIGIGIGIATAVATAIGPERKSRATDAEAARLQDARRCNPSALRDEWRSRHGPRGLPDDLDHVGAGRHCESADRSSDRATARA